MATTSRKKSRVTVKQMKFRNDPMIRLYDKTQDWLQESGRPFVMAVGIVAAAVLLYTAGYYFFSYRQSKAAAAFAEAWEKYNAQVVETLTPNQTGKYYTDEKVKFQEAAEAFERVAASYPGYYGAIGRYLAGASYLHFDKEKGMQILQEVAQKNEQPTSDLAKLALAENYLVSGENDKALQLYEGLLNSSFVPKQVVQLGLGHSYEKAGDNEKAVESYFEVAKSDRTTAAGSDAEKRLSALAPDRLKDLPPPTSTPGLLE